MKRVMAVAAAVLALAGGPARAQCYRTTGCYAPASYAVSNYYTVPYVAPQTYYTPHYDVYSQTAVVGKAYPVYLPLLSYTSVSDDVRSYYSQKRATKDGYLEALREAAAEGIFSGGVPQPPNPNPQPQVQPQGQPQYQQPPPQQPQQPPPQGNPNAPPPKTGGPQVTIGRILQTKCASCHNPNDPARVNLTGDPDRIAGFIRDKCVTLTADRSMPMKGEKLTQGEFDVVQAWAKAAPLEFPLPTKSGHPPGPPAIPPAEKLPKVPTPPPVDRK